MISPRYTLLITLLFSGLSQLLGQDTIFHKNHVFETPVRNVVAADGNIFVKTGSGLYEVENGEWKLVSSRFKSRYVFYDGDFYESDYIPQRFTFDPESMRYLIPQQSLVNPTKAMAGDRLFVAVGGRLYEYSIAPYYTHRLREKSIRDIYIDDSLKVISTYSGIIINDSSVIHEPYYSNGAFVHILGDYYLCNDALYRYAESGRFEKVPWAASRYERLGHFRKLVTIDNNVYGQFTHAICQIDSMRDVTILHQDEEYLDLEVAAGQLVFSTSSGRVYRRESNGTIGEFLQLGSRVSDMYCKGNVLLLSSDEGVYTVEPFNPSSLRKITAHLDVIATQSDARNNLWISTENGLYIKPFNSDESYPVISNVEFNRDAIWSWDDRLYVGSVIGLFEIDVNKFTNDYLDQIIKLKSKSSWDWNYLAYLKYVLILVVGASISFLLFRKKRQKNNVAKERPLTLAQVETDILNHEIISVDQLAEFYKTNPVQLNRMFKNFDTTPGKLLKRVKLLKAKQMLEQGVSIDQVAKTLGNTADYIRKNLAK